MQGIKSKNILLSVDMGHPSTSDWKKIGCSTSDGYNSSRDAVAISTKCSGDFTENLPGDFSWGFSNTSYVDKEVDPTFLTQEELFELSKEDDNRPWKLESIDPDYEYLRTGMGFISDLSNTADAGDYLQFDITITGSGEPMSVETT